MWPLGVLASVITALTSVGAVPMWPRVVHLVALPPIDLYTDFRLLLVHAPSWPTAGAAFVGAMALRIAILAYLMGALSGANLALAARFYSILSVPVFIAATSVTVVSTMPNARFFWSGLGILALSAALVTALPWQGSALLRSAFSSAWRRGLRWEVVLPYFAVLTGIGAAAQLAPETIPWLVPVSVTAAAMALRGSGRRPVRRPRLLMAGVGGALGLAAVVLVATRWGGPVVLEPVPVRGSPKVRRSVRSPPEPPTPPRTPSGPWMSRSKPSQHRPKTCRSL